MSEDYTLSRMSKAVGKSTLFVSNIQRKLGLPVLEEGYSESYMQFVKKVTAMKSFSIATEKIVDLLETEKKILTLLHLDSVSPDTVTWYLEGCNGNKGQPLNPKQSLLLTGFDLGFPIESDHVQQNLNFGEQAKELFAGSEMGEDVRRVMEMYRDMCKQVRKQMKAEKPVIVQALQWVKRVLRDA